MKMKGEQIIEYEDVRPLMNEYMFRRYLLGKDQMKKSLQKVSLPEYIVLQLLKQKSDLSQLGEEKIYLKELAEDMQLTIRQISKIAGALYDKGFVYWSHDEKGKAGTYIILNDEGVQLLEYQENKLNDYFGRIINKFGKDNLIQMLELMKCFERIALDELEEGSMG